MAPRWIIIDSKDAVKLFLFNAVMVDGCDLKVYDVIGAIVTCAMHRDEREEDLSDYLVKVHKEYKDRIPEDHLKIVVHAVSIFARFIFEQIDHFGLYSRLGILWYEFHDFLGYDIVLKNISTMGD